MKPAKTLQDSRLKTQSFSTPTATVMTRRYVRTTMIYCTTFTNIFIQTYKGFLRGPFVLQTFSAHFGAIEGSIKVDGLGSSNANNTRPTGALGLAAAAVSGIIAVCIYY